MHNEENRSEDSPERDRGFEEDAPREKPAEEVLIDKADELCCELLKVSEDQLKEKKVYAIKLVAAIYGLHVALSPQKQAYKKFLKERGIEPGKSTNEFNETTRAVIEHHGLASKRPSIALYAQACHVLKSQSVAPDDAVHWLNEPDKRGGNRGKGRTGFGKTKPLWAESPEGQAEREKKRETREKNAKKYLDEQSQKSANGSSDEGKSVEAAPPPGSPGIGLIECNEAGEWHLKQVLTNDVVKIAQTVRDYLPKTRTNQEKTA